MSHGHGHAAAEGASDESIAAGYELNDTNPRPLVISTVVVFALLAFTFVLVAGMLFVVGQPVGDASHSLQPTSSQLPPEPRLEQNPAADGTRIVTEATERLETYGWVQQQDGIAHIPIERSMELLLEKGATPFGSGQ